MLFLPAYFDEFADEDGWSHDQKVKFVVLTYLVIAIYVVLILLAVLNIWVVIVKLRKYKNLPIFAFYFFTIIAVVLRPISMIGVWTY